MVSFVVVVVDTSAVVAAVDTSDHETSPIGKS
jgi:hypothetical protein